MSCQVDQKRNAIENNTFNQPQRETLIETESPFSTASCASTFNQPQRETLIETKVVEEAEYNERMTFNQPQRETLIETLEVLMLNFSINGLSINPRGKH
ncbi:hypothetical protein [Cyanobacterium aponinum]|uniref:hypothetical protein n=1 Tax=Cyanobacterium aponinum TaxID=379064 RepID=UPI003B9840A7